MNKECNNCGDYFESDEIDRCDSCLKYYCLECYYDPNIISYCIVCKDVRCIDCLSFRCDFCNGVVCFECYAHLQKISYDWNRYYICGADVIVSEEGTACYECLTNGKLRTCCKCFFRYTDAFIIDKTSSDNRYLYYMRVLSLSNEIPSKWLCVYCQDFDGTTYFELLPDDIFNAIVMLT